MGGVEAKHYSLCRLAAQAEANQLHVLITQLNMKIYSHLQLLKCCWWAALDSVRPVDATPAGLEALDPGFCSLNCETVT